MRLAFFIFQLHFLMLSGAKRRIHRRLEGLLTGAAGVNIQIGTPPLWTLLTLDLTFSDLILVDFDCHYPASAQRCPRFCADEAFRRAFCQAMCQRASKSPRCALPSQHYATNSTTYRDLREDLQLSFRGYRPFFGRRSTDTFIYEANTFKKAMSTEVFSVPRIIMRMAEEPFIRGLSTEIRELNGYSDILGVRPGQQSFVPQLKAKGFVDSAVISLQIDAPILYSVGFARSYETIMFGALDKSTCVWKQLPFHDSEGWNIPIEDIKFVDLHQKSSTGRLAIDSPLIQIPRDVAAHYISNGLLFKPTVGQALTVNPKNRTALSLEFRVGGELMTLSGEMLMNNPNNLDTLLALGGEHRYADEAEWVFGTKMLSYFCFGYDYETSRVAWGRRRRLSEVESSGDG